MLQYKGVIQEEARPGRTMKAALAYIIDRSKPLAYLNYLKGQVLCRLGLLGHGSGGTHRFWSVEESIAYIDDVVADYLTYCTEGSDRPLQGKRILEVGPGDTMGVALEFYSRGATSVTAIDRFNPIHDHRRSARIYRALIERMEPERRERALRAVRFEGDVAVLDPACIEHRIHTPVEQAASIFAPGSFDLVISRAVLEHVEYPEAAWRAMTALLTPTGAVWHKIDLRNHNFFRELHPLEYLTLGETSWRLVSRPDPTLNRALTPVWRSFAERDFRSVHLLYTRLIGQKEFRPYRDALLEELDYDQKAIDMVRRIRRRLPLPYREYSDLDLLVDGIFLIASAPKAAQTDATHSGIVQLHDRISEFGAVAQGRAADRQEQLGGAK